MPDNKDVSFELKQKSSRGSNHLNTCSRLIFTERITLIQGTVFTLFQTTQCWGGKTKPECFKKLDFPSLDLPKLSYLYSPPVVFLLHPLRRNYTQTGQTSRKSPEWFDKLQVKAADSNPPKKHFFSYHVVYFGTKRLSHLQ